MTYVHVYPIDRPCEICKAEPGKKCCLPDGTEMKELHATRMRPNSEAVRRDAERYKRGGIRGNKSSAKRCKRGV
jgi:hypothetical protein